MLEIRATLRESDIDAVEHVVSSTGFFSQAECAIAREVAASAWASPDTGYHFLLAEDQGELVAFSCHGPIPATMGSFDLYWIAVLDGCRGQGIGRKLLEAVEDAVKTAGGTRLYVDTSNRPQYAPTLAFYEHCGYERVAELQDFYGPKDGKVIFLKVFETLT